MVGADLDDGDDRVPIYAYPKRFHWLFGASLVIGTVVICILRVWLEPGGPGFGGGGKATTNAILEAIPTSGISSVIIGITLMEVFGVIADLFRSKELAQKNKKLEKELGGAKKDLEEAKAENAKLRRQLEAKDGKDSTEQE